MVKGETKISLRQGMLTLGLVLALMPVFVGVSSAAKNERDTKVTVALLPNGTPIKKLARVQGIAPGLLSAGLGSVVPDQTYLDISQGARAFNSLYNTALPFVLPRGDRIPKWKAIRDRADSAPGSIIPGLFASTLTFKLKVKDGRSAVELEPEMVVPALMAANKRGFISRTPEGCAARRCLAPVLVQNAQLRELPRLISGLRGNDMLVAIERPPPEKFQMLSVGLAGRGLSGNLISNTTRTEGYVLSTDIGPTILARFGFGTPPQMTGRPIRAEGAKDVGALVSLEQRLSVVSSRRGPVLGVAALIWLGLTLGALVFDLLRHRRPGPGLALALRLLALSAIYLPLVLLITSSIRPELGVERGILALGAPLLAALTLALARGWRAVAIASALTVGAHAVDVITGSPLISLSLMGPNPGLGVRFYGIGNELGASLSVLILLGIGAGLAGFAPGLSRRGGAVAFLAVALPLAGVFAAGRFGADVGSAMVIPAGAVAGAAILLRRPLLILASLAVPVLGLAFLAAVDLVSGGDSHFQRSVLDSGGSGDLLDTIARRLRLTGRSFVRAAGGVFLPITAIVIILGALFRTRIQSWIVAAPPALRAGFLAAAFATLLGTAVNDSGVLLLEVGTAYLMLITGYAWAEQR